MYNMLIYYCVFQLDCIILIYNLPRFWSICTASSSSRDGGIWKAVGMTQDWHKHLWDQLFTWPSQNKAPNLQFSLSSGTQDTKKAAERALCPVPQGT